MVASLDPALLFLIQKDFISFIIMNYSYPKKNGLNHPVHLSPHFAAS